jgi:4-carboxymuconolactone decarboxylase
MARIPLPSIESMTLEQRAVYDQIIAGPRGSVVGPLRAALHSPQLAQHWQKFGEVLRYSDKIPKRLRELAIISTGRRWNSQLEFHIHAGVAREEGLADAVIDAVRQGHAPNFERSDECCVYEFTRGLLCDGRVAPRIYSDAIERWGVVAVVELTALIGYYSMVAMTLNAHEIELPDIEGDLLTFADGLTELAPGLLERPDRAAGDV